MKNAELIAKLERMADRKTKHDYDIGHYWNAVEEAAEALREMSEPECLGNDPLCRRRVPHG
jgi:hypothetical protein